MRTLLLHALLAACLSALAPSFLRAQNDDWYTSEGSSSRSRSNSDSGSSSSSSDGYTRPRGLPTSQSSEGWGLGLRLAYAVPSGDASKGDSGRGSPVDQITKGVLKPQIDITYGLNKSFVLGAYVALGGGFLPNDKAKQACDAPDVSCRIMLLESGLLAEYRFLPGRIVNPWLGVNLGIERLSIDEKRGPTKSTVAALGVGFGASVGADVQLGDFGLGPLFALQVGRYMNRSVSISPADDDEDGSTQRAIPKGQRTYHLWLNVGVRARYQFR